MPPTDPPTLPPAGRELDALVAERVMGWRRYRFGPKSLSRHSEGMAWLDDPKNQLGQRGTMEGVIVEAEPHLELYADGLRHVPRYSTDIGAAWQAVDHLWKQGWWLTLNHCGTGAGSYGWQADFSHRPDAWKGVRTDATGQTAPEAICRAALAVARITKEMRP